MKRFLALYLVPAKVMEDWRKTDAETRRPAEEKMRADWERWMREQGAMLRGTEAVGETKRISADGVSDTKNEVHLYSIVEAESREAAARAFENHPHLGIPQSSIEIMELRSLGEG